MHFLNYITSLTLNKDLQKLVVYFEKANSDLKDINIPKLFPPKLFAKLLSAQVREIVPYLEKLEERHIVKKAYLSDFISKHGISKDRVKN